jgi:uncharacterized membrane protein YidH (DUF202 family)
LKVASIIAFLAACALLYYGAVMLLMVPGSPGEQYLSADRVLYGVTPILLSLSLLGAATWLWPRANSSTTGRKRFSKVFSWAISGVGLFWILLMIIAAIRNSTH